MSDRRPVVATTADLAGMLNATRKVLYFVVDALPPDKEREVRDRVAEVISVLEKETPNVSEAKAEIALLHSFLERSDQWE